MGENLIVKRKILVECFAPHDSAPVFTLGLVEGLQKAGVDVYACICKEIDNYNEWNEKIPADHLYIMRRPWSRIKHPISTVKELINIKSFFSGIHFDYWIDTFPIGRCHTIAKVLEYDESIGIDHDVIPHSSTTDKDSSKTKSILSKFDNIAVLSKRFIELAKEKHGLDDSHVFYIRHGAMEYPLPGTETPNSDYDVNYLFFGRIEGYKGLHVLSDAYKKLSITYKNVSLTVAGNGDFSEYEDEFKCLDRCSVINRYIEDDDIALLFSKPRTVVVLPYTDASQSGVVAMAFNYKVPVIVSDTGGLREQLFDGEMGIFVQPADSEDLFRKMEMFLLDSQLYNQQVELMRNGYEKSTWEYVVKEFLQQIYRGREV
ncbi:glycosyltransferase family 4 protein [Butyrivibrio fibrisolvens]|uniref:glycosyltransferase family 4 protein n=1 Tax=Butyrivibrio fibrisolvens TaxID=831 RepID=UPI0006855165|nr:glycosyltransferase family 4 protein [Butyrivibrio fibrisolvens]